MKAFESKVLYMFVSKGDARVAIRGRRKIHNGDIRKLYSSPDLNRMVKSRRMRWIGHVALIGERPRRS
jgi:hypothetical protein